MLSDAFGCVRMRLANFGIFVSDRKINFRLKDWGISRQRYWGCPIPIAYDENNEVVKSAFANAGLTAWKIEDIARVFLGNSVTRAYRFKKCRERLSSVNLLIANAQGFFRVRSKHCDHSRI